MGDFNVDLLNYFADTSTTQFLDQMYSSSLLSQITSPTYISTKSKTLMGNSMSNHPIFLDVDTLTSQILPTPSPPADNAHITNLQKLQPSTLHGSKVTKTFLM